MLCDLHVHDAAADGGGHILHDACCSEVSTDQVRTGLYCVSCSALKQQLMAAADSTAAQLLDLIRAAARESNDRICETYTQMTNDLSKVSQYSACSLGCTTVHACAAKNEQPRQSFEENIRLQAALCFACRFTYTASCWLCVHCVKLS